MKEFWDQRYQEEAFVYGEEPNVYFRDSIAGLEVGKALFPAEGEGRNAVYAAHLGWDVVAFDQSEAAKSKALLLAEKNGVAIDYHIEDMESVDFPKESFDLLVLIYAHFHEKERRAYHQKLISFLKPGGWLIVEGFTSRQLLNQEKDKHAGGPRSADMLYDLEELVEDFSEFKFSEVYESSIILNEGQYHQGESDIVRLLAIKKG